MCNHPGGRTAKGTPREGKSRKISGKARTACSDTQDVLAEDLPRLQQASSRPQEGLRVRIRLCGTLVTATKTELCLVSEQTTRSELQMIRDE